MKIDGNLNDWQNMISQTIEGSSKASISLTEAAWYPYQKFDSNAEGLAHTYRLTMMTIFILQQKLRTKLPIREH
ncbi:hypothetical protein SFC43_21355 [Bacteroides sp. CR5/BHMF/2]|nr:hypothetical protein [Bacteroides sp. CR5/BHMF/2]